MTQFEDGLSAEQLVDRLRLLGNDAVATIEVLESYRQEFESRRTEFEQPQAVAEYIAFFVEMGGRAAAECERIAGGIAGGAAHGHADALRQIASRSADDERRCLVFRDTCINKPLPDEGVRPLLNDISITTRDQLIALRGAGDLADRLEALLAKSPESADEARSFPRRALFTRLFTPLPTRPSGTSTAPSRRRT